ncbi:hypothetical protein ATK86_5636 [Nocardia fluminea]|uniref:Uncharacterized protein n=1 Tax=Nocardia fluminea TaxID=134984 RepID=A0A2N3VHT6_9NOCA|nr:hypothetical protein ATK86_5636 [Nocardia fluminea]
MVEAGPYAVTGRVVQVTGLTDWLPVYPELVDDLTAARYDLRPAVVRTARRKRPGPTTSAALRTASTTRS